MAKRKSTLTNTNAVQLRMGKDELEKKMKRLGVLSLFAVMTACAPLSHHDSVLGDVGEVALRTVACPLTLCMSEVALYESHKSEERNRMYYRWYNSLTPEQQAIEDQREHERSMVVLSALSMNQSLFAQSPSQTSSFTVPQTTLDRMGQRKQTITCETRPFLNGTWTDCR